MAKPSCIIGIDPGASGAIAWSASGASMHATKLDGLTEHDIRGCLIGLVELYDSVHAFLEQVGPNRIAKSGERRQGTSSMFAFGRNYGFLRGLLVGLQIPFDDVPPQKWQRAIGIGVVKDEKPNAKKNRHKAKAQQFWPYLKVTLHTCDALLIAEYGERQYRLAPQINEAVGGVI